MAAFQRYYIHALLKRRRQLCSCSVAVILIPCLTPEVVCAAAGLWCWMCRWRQCPQSLCLCGWSTECSAIQCVLEEPAAGAVRSLTAGLSAMVID
jgi:hypothetical protein